MCIVLLLVLFAATFLVRLIVFPVIITFVVIGLFKLISKCNEMKLNGGCRQRFFNRCHNNRSWMLHRQAFNNNNNNNNVNVNVNVNSEISPSTDIIEKEDCFIIESELAGVDKDSIKVNVVENKLVITAERKSKYIKNQVPLEGDEEDSILNRNKRGKEFKQFCKTVAGNVIEQQKQNGTKDIIKQIAQAVCVTLSDNDKNENQTQQKEQNQEQQSSSNVSEASESVPIDDNINKNDNSTNKYLWKENKIGKFKKEVVIKPENLNLSEINASFVDGLLTITLLKREPVKFKVNIL